MKDVQRSPYPVIIAGDTNLPGSSWALAHWFGEFQDGFDEAGSGFGYTYPLGKRRPWLRLDRVLAGPQFRFVDFGVIESKASDHLAVLAELELRDR
jgi:endonuclease/exonuclease/phosphatase family metal-dependent hydrolase